MSTPKKQPPKNMEELQNALQAMQVVDYVYVLTNGVVTVSGPSEQLIGDSSLVEAYLGK